MKTLTKTLSVIALALLMSNAFASNHNPVNGDGVKTSVKIAGKKHAPLDTHNVTIANHSTKNPFFFFSSPSYSFSGSGPAGATTYYDPISGTYTVLIVGLANDASSVRVVVNGVTQTSTGGNLTFTGVVTPILIQLFTN